MRRALPVPIAAALLWACGGDPTQPGPVGTEFSAINGAVTAAVLPGELITLEGHGFRNAQGENSVLVTTDAGLAAAPVTLWRNQQIRATLPANAVSGSTFVELDGARLGPVGLFVRRPEPYDPATRPWVEGTRLPRPLWGLGAVALRFPNGTGVSSVVVVTGGTLVDSTLSDSTYLGTVDADGMVTGWTAAPDTVVPAARSLHAMAGADRTNARLDTDLEAVAYMVGGMDTAGRILPDLLGMSVAADGSYGLWSTLTPLPQARAGAAAVVTLGNLFVIGGIGPDSLAATTALAAVVNGSGTLNGWFEGPRLPEGRAFAAVGARGNRLYVVGGQTGFVDPDSTDPSTPDLRPTVYSIALSPRTGFFADSAWTELPVTLAAPRARHAVLVLDSAVVVTGGVYAGMPGPAETEVAAILPGGALAPFAPSGQALLADLAGGPLQDVAAAPVWDASGAVRLTLFGGRRQDGEISHSVWWH